MGVVYPHIMIKDTENPSLLQLDATNHTVLVPVPFVERYYCDSEGNVKFDSEEKNIRPTLYTDAESFIDDFSTGAGEWSYAVDKQTGEIIWNKPKNVIPRCAYTYAIRYEQNKPSIVYTPEKSYLMTIELLKRGLPVLVKPISVDLGQPTEDSEGNPIILDSEGNVLLSGRDTTLDTSVNVAISAEKTLFSIVDNAISTKKAFDDITDKNIYNVKFITSGGYPNLGWSGFNDGNNKIYSTSYLKLAELAASRGDAIAILELMEKVYNKQKLIDTLDSSRIPDLSSNFDLYKTSAIFTPWCEFSIEKRLPAGLSDNVKERIEQVKKFNLSTLTTMPAGFAYLMAYAYSIQTNESWFAAAGVMRGQIPQMVRPLFEIGEAFMEDLQGKRGPDNRQIFDKIRLNPIMNTGSYGYRIWGNRVAAPYKDVGGVYKTMYIEFLNVRMLLCDIKKQIYAAAVRTTFEPNDDITWISFKVLCNNLLDRMKSGRGLLWYRWTKLVSEERATIKARLTVRPIEAVEAFDITVFLSDQDVDVEE